MLTCRIDDVLGGPEGLLPAELYAYAAAHASSAGARASVQFHGIFVEVAGEAETTERWSVVHSAMIDPLMLKRFGEIFPPQDAVEHGAIAVIAAVLQERQGIHLLNVSLIDTHMDYTLADRGGKPAGALECAGVSGRLTSEVASRKRANVKKATLRPVRIGIVAFGGPELRLEVVA